MVSTTECEQLVVLGSTVTALAVVRSGDDLGLRCVVADTEKGPAIHSRYGHFTHLVGDDAVVVELVVNLANQMRSALIADSDRWLRWIVRHRDVLESHYNEVLHPRNSVLEICLNKTSFVQWCKTNDVSAPKLYEVDDANDLSLVEFPVLVRPELTLHGTGSQLPKAIEVDNAQDLMNLLERYLNLESTANICESLLRPNIKQYSVGVVRNSAGKGRSFVAEKLRPLAESCAGGTYVIGSNESKVTSFVEDTLTKLQFSGIAEIEIILDCDSNALYLLEINARPWVQYALAVRSGYDFLKFLLAEDQYKISCERQHGKRWISFGDDLYTVFSRSEGMFTVGKIGFFEYLRTLVGANVFSLWNWRDPWPYLVSMYRRLRPSVKQRT